MIEPILIKFLSAKLGLTVTAEKQTGEVTGPAVVIDKTGSSESNHISTATVAIQSYDVSKLKASMLNDRVKAAMRTIAEEVTEVTSCSLNSDYSYMNTVTKEYRYQAVYDLVYYEEE
jgi:hypothetical protein